MFQIPTILITFILIGYSALTAEAAAKSGEEIFQQQCAACHARTSPALTTEGRTSQKGPALGYAGIKYRPTWAKKWLQKPSTIRPGGMFSGNHTTVTDDGDIINPDSLSKHLSLSADDAGLVVDYFSQLTERSELIKTGEYVPKKVSQRMGSMNFRKFKGCSSCHQDQPEFGGISGPELYTAYSRLNPDFIVSFIRNPVAWDGLSLMPHTGLKDKDIHKLVHYLKLISGEEK